MNSKNKVEQLQSVIRSRLSSLIDNNYVLLDLPYHSNLGDTLIWQGELDFLKDIPYRCKYSTWHSGNIEKINKILNPDTIILLHGGGNFGDVWPTHQLFRKEIISRFPNNKTIIFPQTIFYSDSGTLKEDQKFFASHQNVIICARDSVSFKICKENFPHNISLLVPDMAFCMDLSSFKRCLNPKGKLFVRRTDHEISEIIDYSRVPKDATISDWLWLEQSKEYYRRFLIEQKLNRFDSVFGTDVKNVFNDLYWKHILKKLNVATAINFIDKYQEIYTTRMHAAILSVILGKENVTLFDNNYGKSSSFYSTWLNDVDGLKLCR